MSNTKEPISAQATRSFGDYTQGAWYAIDPNDGQLMALLGAGYFDTEGNDNLTRERITYEAGEVVTAESVEAGNGEVGAESGGDSSHSDRARTSTRQSRNKNNG